MAMLFTENAANSSLQHAPNVTAGGTRGEPAGSYPRKPRYRHNGLPTRRFRGHNPCMANVAYFMTDRVERGEYLESHLGSQESFVLDNWMGRGQKGARAQGRS
jgi:hypothetical protein